MQTTLLGLAIAIILALVTALVAPLVVDWNNYRAAFEKQASRLTGLDVRVNGAIEARILPTPRIDLRDVTVGASGREPQIRVARLQLEVGLGPLLRGEVRASEMRLVEPQVSLGLDRTGAIEWPAATPTFRLDAVTISRLSIENGRVTLADAASGTRVTLQKLWFNGDVRSLAGSFKGEGAFVAEDALYGYRISANRDPDDGILKLRLGIDPSDYPLTTDIDGTLNFDGRVPQFAGTLAMARPAAAALADGERLMNAPWHLAAKLQATPAAARLDDIAFQYGPDERPLNVSGKAELTLGAHPHLDAAMSAGQVDADRVLAAPDHRSPLLVARSFAESLVAAVKLPLPAALGVAVDALTVGGNTVESLHGTLSFDGHGWSIKNLGFHAPGLTEVSLSGRLGDASGNLAFSGPASIDSADPKALAAWLEGRNDVPGGLMKTLSARGELTIASDRFALDRLTATLDRENLEGRLAYTWATNAHPASVDAELRAGDLDVDALLAFAKAATSDGGLEVPRDVNLVLDVDKATFAGVDSRNVNARLKFDAGVLHIDRLSVGDLGGAALDVSGRIDELSSQPRGRLTLNLDAKALAGLTSVVGKFAPQATDDFRRFADRMAPARVHAVLTVDRAADTPATSVVKLTLGGDMGGLRVSLNGEARGEAARPAAAIVRVAGRLDADDGGALLRLLGLDRIVDVDQLPGQMTMTAAGPLDGDLRFNGLATAGGFSTIAGGTLRLVGKGAPAGRLQIKMSAADLGPLRRAMTGQTGVGVPVSARASLALAGTELSFTDVAAAIGTASVRGRLDLKMSSPMSLNGDIAAEDVDAGTVLGMLLGLPSATPNTVPGATPNAGGPWSRQPLGSGAFAAINGAVTFKLDRAAFSPTLVMRNLKGVARLGPSTIALEGVDGSLAGGHLTGEVAFRRDADKLAAQGHLDLAGADAAKLLAAETKAVDGRLGLHFQFDSMGLSPSGLVGSLHGSAGVTLNDVHIAGIDPGAFGSAIHITDQGGAIETTKIRSVVGAAMSGGHLTVPQGGIDVTIAAGQIRVANAVLHGRGGTELGIGGAIDLNSDATDLHLTLSGAPPPNALVSNRPELALTVRGPITASVRTIDVSPLVSWLTLRAAELQTRRLESIEANRRADAPNAVVHPTSPAVRFVPLGTAQESAAPPATPASSGRGLDRLRPEPPPVVAPDESRIDPPGADHAAAAALPPPLVIKPVAPHPESATANAGTADPSHRQPSAPPPAPHASPFDFLFRSQN